MLCIERAPLPACPTNDLRFVLNLSSRELPLKWWLTEYLLIIFQLADQLEKVDEKLKSMEILLENKVWNCISTPSLRVLCCAAQGLVLVCTSLCLHRHSYSDLWMGWYEEWLSRSALNRARVWTESGIEENQQWEESSTVWTDCCRGNFAKGTRCPKRWRPATDWGHPCSSGGRA